MSMRRDDKICRLLMSPVGSAVLQRKGRGQNDIFTPCTARYDTSTSTSVIRLTFQIGYS